MTAYPYVCMHYKAKQANALDRPLVLQFGLKRYNRCWCLAPWQLLLRDPSGS